MVCWATGDRIADLARPGLGGAVVGCLCVALGSFEALYRDADHTLAAATPLLIQVRRGAMTLEALTIIDRRIRELRARTVGPGARVCVVAVLEEGAPVVRDDVRVAQRRVVHSLLEGVDARMAVVVVGDGIGSTLQRTVARGIAFANPRVRIVKAPEEAATWMAPHAGATAAEVRSAVEHARTLR
ncbi:Hypothetical protein A7982_04682 [Minicystis rosea]|nr:Hypothetical protein A7982_04682 [Minicystis rosea]